jgi:predicted RNase H-like HicB family nuclease
MDFNKVKDGEGFEMELGTQHMIACCDCGLVHRMAIARESNGNIGLAFTVDEEETNIQRKQSHKYRVMLSWSPEDNAWIAEFPELSGCLSHGDTPIDALIMALSVSSDWIRIAKEDGWNIEPVFYKQTP